MIGSRAAAQIESQYPSPTPSLPGYDQFETIASKIAAVADVQKSTEPIKFALLVTDDPISLSYPDGHVFISTGLLGFMNQDQDQIACLLAHEAAHVLLHHDEEQLVAALGDENVADMLSQGKYQEVTNIQIQLSRLSYSKEQEFDADRKMVELVKSANYDPKGMLTFLNAIAKRPHVENQVSWYDSHPMPKSRFKRLADIIRETAAKK